jgi:hypothetical protein
VPSLVCMTPDTVPNTGALPAAAPAASSPSSVPSATYADSKNLSVIAFILGLSSLLLGQTFLVPIAAIVVGVIGYRREPSGHALAVWGIVLGALMAFGWLVVAIIGLALAGPFFLVGLF